MRGHPVILKVIMTINMNDEHLSSVADLAVFNKAADKMEFSSVGTIGQKYVWVEKALTRFRYFSVKKKARGEVRKYIRIITGYSVSQLTKLIHLKKVKGLIKRSDKKKHKFETRYNRSDVELLVTTDNAHSRLSAPATKEILIREYKVFGKNQYERIKHISLSHIYNLRKTDKYKESTTTFEKTNPVDRDIGERRKPHPGGKPGFLRVDTVHQGDLNGEKGVYHINFVDEVTQFEMLGCVETICEEHIAPLLEKVLIGFPTPVLNFHTDNGSEYINRAVSAILNRLLIQQSKSRSRHSNDNALAEGKNGAIIRKHMGRNHIPKKHAEEIDDFYHEFMNPYLNFHRPCGFATNYTDRRGKIKKKYESYMTPYEKLKSLPNAVQYLKEGVTFEMLDKIAYQFSDNEWAEKMQKAKKKLFENFRK